MNVSPDSGQSFHRHSLSTQQSDEADVNESIGKILEAAEASLLVCNFFVAMERLEIESHLENIVQFVQYQVENSIRSGRNLLRASIRSKKRLVSDLRRKFGILLKKLVQIIELFVTLVERHPRDKLFLELLKVSTKSLFRENIETLQIVCIKLALAVGLTQSSGHNYVQLINFDFRFSEKTQNAKKAFSKS